MTTIIVEILVLLVPGLIASVFFCKLKKTPVKSFELLIYFFIFAFLINLFHNMHCFYHGLWGKSNRRYDKICFFSN